MTGPERKRKRKHGGFTLIEVLVSLVLGAIAMIGVIALYRAQINASSFSRRATEASVLAEDQLERLRTATGTSAGSTVIDETGKAVAGGTFTRTFLVTDPGTYFDMSVTVSWVEEGRTKAVTMVGRRNK